jgi:hypothetical protein
MDDKDYEKVYQQSNQEKAAGYKDSEDARYEKEVGDPNEDVFVKDTFKNGEIITFIWNRKKSNDNVDDTGTGKEGFSFYQARYVYRDPYKQKGTVKTSNPNGLSVVGTIFEGDEEAMLVVQEKEEGKDKEGNRKVRIFSATYANDKIRADYFKRALDAVRRNGGVLPHLEESLGNDAFIARTAIKHRRLQ